MKVLISPGYGAGWSTWNEPKMAVDKRLIQAVECGITEDDMEKLCESLGYKNPYMGGFVTLEVVDVPSGFIFKVEEYDGNEYIKYFNDDEWYMSCGEYYEE